MSVSDYWLTTERLALRSFTRDDLDWLVSVYADPDVTRYLGGPKDRDKTEEMLDVRILEYYQAHPGLGVWMTVDRSSGQPVGFHLLNHIHGESIIQIGFTLVKAAWGNGFGTEMAAAVLRYGFADLSLPSIAGIANLENVASQRVLQKIGLHRRGERVFPHPNLASQGPMAWFQRNAADWLAERDLRQSSTRPSASPQRR